MLAYDEAEKNNYQYIVFEVDERRFGLGRDEIVSTLRAEGVLARRYFYPGCHRMEPYRSLFPHAGTSPAEHRGDRATCLPRADGNGRRPRRRFAGLRRSPSRARRGGRDPRGPRATSAAVAMTPKVSVCVITYNQERYVIQAVEGALTQEADFDFEVVVGDDASSDGTPEILRDLQVRYPDRLRLILREKNIGPARNFLDVLGACRGEYVAILDGDDYWTSPEKLQKQADALDADPTLAICSHRVEHVFEDEGGANPLVDYDDRFTPPRRERGTLRHLPARQLPPRMLELLPAGALSRSAGLVLRHTGGGLAAPRSQRGARRHRVHQRGPRRLSHPSVGRVVAVEARREGPGTDQAGEADQSPPEVPLLLDPAPHAFEFPCPPRRRPSQGGPAVARAASAPRGTRCLALVGAGFVASSSHSP